MAAPKLFLQLRVHTKQSDSALALKLLHNAAERDSRMELQEQMHVVSGHMQTDHLVPTPITNIVDHPLAITFNATIENFTPVLGDKNQMVSYLSIAVAKTIQIPTCIILAVGNLYPKTNGQAIVRFAQIKGTRRAVFNKP